MSVNGCAKGKAKEREAVHLLRRLGFPCERNARNGISTGDILGKKECAVLERVHLEVKGRKDIDLGTVALDKACAQAAEEAANTGRRWAVLWYAHRRGWRLTYRLEGLLVTVCGDHDIRASLRRLAGEGTP